ncbi:MAG: hypothetical protein ACR652_25855 [Methylocystis sp.]|uniref:hypothetical protein n=1 Tax=Methylocystis sp. TaxID=1911079 RepID=UPI003DA50DF5
MKAITSIASIFVGASLICSTAFAEDKKPAIAVFGDWPYNNFLLENASRLVDSVNSDPSVRWVLHVGDIHSGSQPCTSAKILRPISTSNPGWNQSVFAQFQKFKSPLVYTPGDNEWSDCHKTKEGKSGQPLKELTAVRELFFARPGKTLGLEEKDVWSQAEKADKAFPADAKFVENVMWYDFGVVFVTLNVPGSNNDTRPWTNGFEDAAHATEVQERTDANIRWLKKAFDMARLSLARGVVIAIQADMWDPEALLSGGDGLDAYTPFVQQLSASVRQFGRPVLLLNGDSHVFKADRPLADPQSASGQVHKVPATPNLQRIVVQGSTTAPAEWLRLTLDPTSRDVFSWTNVPYCADPTGAC